MAEKSKLTKKDAELALKSLIESVEEALEKGDKVQLVGFGTFETRERAAREGRNPRTKEVIKIPATTVPVFKAGKEFKDKVNK
jgi:DNA-binding protein HU-beta